MITIIMSVGFSVDYSAHIAYGYVVSKAAHSKERIQEALGDLGWPVIQVTTPDIQRTNEFYRLKSNRPISLSHREELWYHNHRRHIAYSCGSSIKIKMGLVVEKLNKS